jgi:lambda family phage tail tape measure protein
MAMNMDAMLRIKADVQGENNIRRLGNSMQGLQGQVKNASMAVSGLGMAFRGLGAALAVGGFATAIKGAVDLADNMRDLSQRTGVSVETLGQFKVAAELSGSSLEGVAKGLGFLNRNMVAAATGTKAAAAAFRTVGVAITDSTGQLRSADQVFLDVADKFAQMRDGPEKAALAVKLFGKAGAELIPILNLGSKEIEKFGLGIGSNFANQADAFNDRLGLMKAQLTVLTVQVGSALLPVMNLLLDAVVKGVQLFGKFIAEIYKSIGGIAGLQQVVASLTKAMVVLGGVTAGVFVATNITTFANALRGVVGVMRTLVSLERAMLAIETARAAVVGLIAGVKSGKTPASAIIGGVVGGGLAAGALGVGISKLIDDITKRISVGIQGAFNDGRGLPEININGGLTPDLGGLSGSDGAKAVKDKARQTREAVEASRNALAQSRAELAILREADPIRKIQLEYQEKRRALIAATTLELSRELPIEQQANIQRKRNVDLDKLEVEEKKALADAYKELGDAAYEAALKTTQWGSAAEAANTAMAGFRDGISSYLESIGTLGEGISSITQNAFKGLEDAIVSLTTTGTFNFRQFALSVVEEMTRMVTRLLIIAPILQAIQSLIPGGGIGASFPSGAGLLSKGKLFSGGIFGNGAAFDRAGIQAFAMGGVVNRPTIFPFANGGAGRLGLMGEAGPEAIIPLKRGADGKLGVAGGGSTSVTVNVDAKGTSVQGDGGRGEQLARVVAQAVQAELIRQKRPGGLMAA